MLIKEIMQTKLVCVKPETTVREAATKMRDDNVGCVMITNATHLKGFVTDRDIACWLSEGKNPDTVKEESIMRKNVVTAPPDTDVFEAGRLMSKNRIRRLPVVENGIVCGILTTSDLAPVIEEEIDNFLHLEETHRH